MQWVVVRTKFNGKVYEPRLEIKDGDVYPNIDKYEEVAEELCVLGEVTDEYDGDEEDRMIIELYRRYPYPTGIEETDGWLAPDGRYYLCGAWMHLAAAKDIYMSHYGTVPEGDAMIALDELGWAQIMGPNFLVKREKVTDAMVDTLLQLITIAERDTFIKACRKGVLYGGGFLPE